MARKSSLVLLLVLTATALSGCASDLGAGDGDLADPEVGAEGPRGGAPSQDDTPGTPQQGAPLPPDTPLWGPAPPPGLELTGCRSIEIDYPLPATQVEEPAGMDYARVDPAGLVVDSRGLVVECDGSSLAPDGGFLVANFFVLVTPDGSPLPDAEHRHLYEVYTDMPAAQAFFTAWGVHADAADGFVRSTPSPAGPAAQMEYAIGFAQLGQEASTQSVGAPDPAAASARQVVWVTGPGAIWVTPGFPGSPPEAEPHYVLVAERSAATDAADGLAVQASETDLHPFVMPRRPSHNAFGFGLVVSPAGAMTATTA